MKKIKYLILGLISLLNLYSCSKEDRNVIEEPDPDPYDTLEFYSIEYDFSKKEINVISSPEFKESFENNSDQIIPVTLYPYLDQGTVEFTLGETDKILDGLECEVPVPSFENDTWSETESTMMKISFGSPINFNPFNGNISFTINAYPWETTLYGYILTFSELIVPFEATFIGGNYGSKYNFTGIFEIRIPINCEIKIEETEP